VKKSTVLIILGVLGGFVLFVGAIVWVVFYATSGVTGAADQFFATARGGDPNATYAATSTQLHSVTTPEQLDGFIKQYRLNQVADTSWSSRSFENNIGNVQGSVTLDDGSVVPLSIQLVKEGDAWKVSFIDTTQAGAKGGVR
jgi:hypothetical protein